MENNELMQIMEAIVLRDSVALYMNKITEQYKGHPDYAATMRFCGQIYKKYYQIADKRVMTDETGRLTIRRDIRKNFDLN